MGRRRPLTYHHPSAATLLVWAVWSDRIKKRYPFVLAGLVFCCVGFIINISPVSIGAKYFGTFLIVAGAYAGFPGVVAWYIAFSFSLCHHSLCADIARARQARQQPRGPL